MTEERKFLHLMHDINFVDYFINQSEEVYPLKSDYWIIGEESPLKLKSIHPLGNRIIWNQSKLNEYANHAKKYEKIFLHSFFMPYLNEFLKKLPDSSSKIVWFFWGGDGYNFTTKSKNWYLPLTWKEKQNLLLKEKSFWKSKFFNIRNKRYQYKKAKNVKELIKKVHICATWVKYDYEMIRHINNKLDWNFYSYYTYEQMNFNDLEFLLPDKNRLFLGNSATDTNNHFDALTELKNSNYNGEIIVPLSYGNSEYAKVVVEYGKSLFGNRFVPITEVLSLNDYHKLLNSCGIVWMNHLRQQATGNIIAALYLGKAVILNPENNVFKTFKDWGILFANNENLVTDTFNFKSFENNRKIIEKYFSKDYILNQLKTLYNK